MQKTERICLSDVIDDLPSHYILLVLTKHEGLDTVVELVKDLFLKDSNVVYVTVNKPAAVVMDYLKKAEVDAERVFFIDCATASVSGESARLKNILFVSPQNLTGLSLAINELLGQLPGKTSVVFDSVDTLLVYNPPSMLQKFAHFIANKIRLNKVDGILVASANSNKELVSLLRGVSDRAIETM